MGRRTLLLIASILVAAVGTALIGLYVRGADNRARGDAARVEVLVATRVIEIGTTPDAGAYKLESRQSGDLPNEYLTDPAQIKGRAVTRILLGATLQQGMFSTSAARSIRVLEKGHQAVAITLGDPQRVASLLTPDAQVYVYVTKAGKTARVFDDPVSVIGVGDDTGTFSRSLNQDLPRTNVTLDLRDGQVADLLDSQVDGPLWFGYVGPAPTPSTAG